MKRDRAINYGLAGCFIRDVEHEGGSRRTDGLCRLLYTLRVAIADDHLGAVGRQPLCHRQTDSRSRAGHDRRLAFQPHATSLNLLFCWLMLASVCYAIQGSYTEKLDKREPDGPVSVYKIRRRMSDAVASGNIGSAGDSGSSVAL